jgi:hypothetical protein
MANTPQRELATVNEYRALLVALRARAEELQLSRLAIDYLGGLASGHSGKILGPKEGRRIGAVSLGKLCKALAIKLIIVDDPIQRARNAKQVFPRDETCVRHRNNTQNNSAAP